jgi:hypothetical protein
MGQYILYSFFNIFFQTMNFDIDYTVIYIIIYRKYLIEGEI